jgi:hypothetical protein
MHARERADEGALLELRGGVPALYSFKEAVEEHRWSLS